MFEVGQTVYCAANGKGKVVQIEKWGYPIKVLFDTRDELNYTFDGKLHSNLDRSLFFSKPVVEGAIEPAYEPKFKPGERVFVTMGDDVYGAIQVLKDFKDHVMTTNGSTYPKDSYDFYRIGEKVE